MLRSYIIILLALFCFTPSALAQQQLEDVVYLKNGAITRGAIIEQIPNVSIKIQTRDGNILVYRMEEIAKIAKERRIGFQGTSVPGKKSPTTAFILSFLVPGVGQHYNGDVLKGLIQEGLVAGGLILAFTAGYETTYSSWWDFYQEEYVYEYYEETGTWFWVGIGVASATAIWSWIDAPISASRINRKREGFYGHLLEFNSDKQVIGVDLSTNGKTIGAKLSMHF